MKCKVVSKKRWSIVEGEAAKEYVFFCHEEADVLSCLSGYRKPVSMGERVNATDLLEAFDPCRPQRTVTMVNGNGETDTLSLHTLH
jgi:hypothetical protein